jgi:hypothetical protein
LNETTPETYSPPAAEAPAEFLEGSVRFMDRDGASAAEGQAYTEGLTVLLTDEAGGEVDRTLTREGGRYRFQAPSGGRAGGVKALLPDGSFLVFSESNPEGEQALRAGRGDPAEICVTDEGFPNGEITFTGGRGAQGHVNPTGVRLTLRDDSGESFTAGWEIVESAGGAVIVSGGEISGGVESAGLAAALARLVADGPDGVYVLRIYVRDAAGNTTRVFRSFEVLRE